MILFTAVFLGSLQVQASQSDLSSLARECLGSYLEANESEARNEYLVRYQKTIDPIAEQNSHQVVEQLGSELVNEDSRVSPFLIDRMFQGADPTDEVVFVWSHLENDLYQQVARHNERLGELNWSRSWLLKKKAIIVKSASTEGVPVQILPWNHGKDYPSHFSEPDEDLVGALKMVMAFCALPEEVKIKLGVNDENSVEINFPLLLDDTTAFRLNRYGHPNFLDEFGGKIRISIGQEEKLPRVVVETFLGDDVLLIRKTFGGIGGNLPLLLKRHEKFLGEDSRVRLLDWRFESVSFAEGNEGMQGLHTSDFIGKEVRDTRFLPEKVFYYYYSGVLLSEGEVEEQAAKELQK